MSTVTTGSLGSVAPSGQSNAVLDYSSNAWNFSESGSVNFDNIDYYRQWGVTLVIENEAYDDSSGVSSGSWSSYTASLNADSTYKARVRGNFRWWDFGLGAYQTSTKYGTTKTKKTGAVAASASTPTATSITATTATIGCYYTPNVSESDCSAQLQYKAHSSGTWINAGTAGMTKGYTQVTSLTAGLTGLTANTLYDVQLVITRTTTTGTSLTSATYSFTTIADAPVVTTSAATSVDHDSATLNGTVDCNGISTTVAFRWGLVSGVLDHTTDNVSGSPFTVDGVTAISIGITGLASNTTYYCRAVGTHAGGNVFGYTLSFVTSAPPATPDITTDAATSISHTSATLNGTVNPNTHSTQYKFQYVTSAQYAIDGWTSATTTASQGPSTAGTPFAYNQALTGLTAGTAYSFRAVAVYDSESYYGSLATFSTTASPEASASKETHVIIYEFDRIYGVTSTLYFLLVTPSATDSDTFLNAAAPYAAAECLISKDGGAFAQTTNAIARVGTDQLFKIELTAAELQAEDVWILAHDNALGARDVAIHVRTKIQTGQLTVNAGEIATNTDAVALTSNGSGKAIDCIAGDIYTAGSIQMAGDLNIGDDLLVGDDVTITGSITAADMTLSGALTASSIAGVLSSMVLASGTISGTPTSTTCLLTGASTTANIYNGCILAITGGTGAGQSRMITAYSAGRVATISADNAFTTTPSTDSTFIVMPGPDLWDQSPLAELSALPAQDNATTGTYGRLLQFVFQRFAYKRTQTAATQTLYKSNGTDALGAGDFTDTTTLQTVGKLA